MLIAEYANQIIYTVLLLLIISILINLFFVSSGIHKKTSKSDLKKNTPNIIQSFLLQQANNTENAKRHNQRKHLSKRVINLRNAYLTIEARAIDRDIDTQEYWNFLGSNIQKLLGILVDSSKPKALSEIEEKINAIKFKVSQSPQTESTQKVIESLDKFLGACIEHKNNPKKLAIYSKKLETLINKLDSVPHRKLSENTEIHDAYTQSSQNALKTIKSHISSTEEASSLLSHINPDDFDFSIKAFDNNKQALSESVEIIEGNIQRINESNKLTKAAIFTSTEKETTTRSSELDALSEEIQYQNEKEIERLRKIIKDQKNIIFELEEGTSNAALHAPKPSTTANASKNQRDSPDISKLKQSLKESEHCIDTLESELDSLRKKYLLQKENPKAHLLEAPLTDGNLKTIENTIAQLKADIANAKEIQNDNTTMFDFISECLDAGSIEDISLSIYQALSDLDWSIGLILKADSRTLEIDPAGLLSDREKMLISSMQIDEIDSKNNGKTICFRHKNISGKLVANNFDYSLNQKHTTVLCLLKTTDKIIGKLKSDQALKRQKNTLQKSANDVKKLAHEVDITIDKINKRTKESVSNSFGQIQDIARSKGLNATQIASFKNLENQTLNEITADNSLRLKVKKQFLLILKGLEDIE